MPDGRNRTIVVVLAAVIVVGAGLVSVLSLRAGDDVDSGRRHDNRCPVAPADGEMAIEAAIAACPDGSTVVFPANRHYQQNNRILIRDRVNLTIDGNGSTFTTTAYRAGEFNGNWLVLRGQNITIRNVISVGAFDLAPPRSLAKIPAGYSEANPNYGLYGVDGAHLVDVKGSKPWGDGVTTGPDIYVDSTIPTASASYTRNVLIERMTVETTARMCWGPTSGINITIQDSSCRDAWYSGLDAEIDNPAQPLQGLRVVRNTFDGFGHSGIGVPVAAGQVPTRDIEIRGNRMLTVADDYCAPSIVVGLYPDSNPALFHDVITADNELPAYGSGIVYDHVDTGAITGNTLHRLERPGFTPEGLCGVGNAEPIRTSNSRNVIIASNVVRP